MVNGSFKQKLAVMLSQFPTKSDPCELAVVTDEVLAEQMTHTLYRMLRL